MDGNQSMGGWYTSANGKSARRYPTPAQCRTTIRLPLSPPHIGVPLPHIHADKRPAPARARPCSWCLATFARNHTHFQPQNIPHPAQTPTSAVHGVRVVSGCKLIANAGAVERSRAENRGPTLFLTPQNRWRQFGASHSLPIPKLVSAAATPQPGVALRPNNGSDRTFAARESRIYR